MKVVVASGKGGTGKTLVATSLALAAEERMGCALLDADVEAPNAALFLHPSLSYEQVVERLVPEVDAERCEHCGRCTEVCQFGAILALPQRTLVLPELCHSCGSCARQCPPGAIREVAQPVGTIEAGRVGDLDYGQGRLTVGEAMATPVIRALKAHATERGWDQRDLLLLDAPPGTACPVVETLRGADVALLVTEPTPFGLHDLRLALRVARDELGLPVAVTLNKDGDGATEVEDYCRGEGVAIVLRIPLAREIAAAYAERRPLIGAFPGYRDRFLAALERLAELARGGGG